MEESRKKPIMIGVIVVCLAVAAVVYYKTRTESSSSLPGSYLMKCKNPDCGAVYKIDRDDYSNYLREYSEARSGEPPSMVCKECGKETAFRAVKCKCGEVFFYDLYPDDFPDRCPKCGFSKAEDDWKRKTSQ